MKTIEKNSYYDIMEFVIKLIKNGEKPIFTIFGGKMNVQTKRWLMVILAILMNALGNAMMAYTNLGNTYWGIAALNITAVSQDKFGKPMEFGTAILIITLCLYVYNRIALKQYRPVLDTLSLIITVTFSLFINFFIAVLSKTVNLEGNLVLANVLWAGGLLLMTASISMYLKPNLIVPAFDENMGVFAKIFFNGNFAKAGYLATAVAMVITAICSIIRGALPIGFTLYALVVFVIFGHLINFFFAHMKFYDKFIEFGEFDKSGKTE